MLSLRPRSIFACLLVASLVGACATSNGTPAPAPSGTPMASAGVAGSAPASPSAAASGGLAGAHVRVLGLWSGPELASFQTVISAWEQRTGAVVDWQGTDFGDLEGQIQTRHPDIAILPNLAVMARLADQGLLVPLDSALDMTAIARDYAPAWIDLGSRAGKLYGIFSKVTNKAAVWYDPKAFMAAGYKVPKTWTEMLALADTIVDDGHNPFSITAAQGPASGWALTDWISEIVLNQCGADVYDRWIAGKVPWNQSCIKAAFDRFTKVLSTKGYVLGGADRILSTGDDTAADALYTDPPTAWLCYLASFAQAFIASGHPDLDPGTDYDTFPFPTIEPANAGAVTVGADVPVMVTDTPAARAFMTYLAGAEAQETWIKLGGFTSVNRSVPADTYPDPVARSIAGQVTTAKVSRFSAGDMLPAALQRAWWGAMLDLVKDPSREDAILDQLTAAAKNA